MSSLLCLQFSTEVTSLPSEKEFESWIMPVLSHEKAQGEITLRFVDEAESQHLNFEFRKKNKPTNVLSFPCQLPKELPFSILGDLVFCAPLVIKEAQEQGKSLTAHWAHLSIHGVLHLLGYDHVDPLEAESMETLEIEFMKQLGFPNPYEVINAGAPPHHEER